MMVGALVLPPTIVGMIEASAIRRPSMPCTHSALVAHFQQTDGLVVIFAWAACNRAPATADNHTVKMTEFTAHGIIPVRIVSQQGSYVNRAAAIYHIGLLHLQHCQI